MLLTKTSVEAASAISTYLLTGMHHSTPEGQRAISEIITRAQIANPSKALRALVDEAIDGRCPTCGDSRHIEIDT